MKTKSSLYDKFTTASIRRLHVKYCSQWSYLKKDNIKVVVCFTLKKITNHEWSILEPRLLIQYTDQAMRLTTGVRFSSAQNFYFFLSYSFCLYLIPYFLPHLFPFLFLILSLSLTRRFIKDHLHIFYAIPAKDSVAEKNMLDR